MGDTGRTICLNKADFDWMSRRMLNAGRAIVTATEELSPQGNLECWRLYYEGCQKVAEIMELYRTFLLTDQCRLQSAVAQFMQAESVIFEFE